MTQGRVPLGLLKAATFGTAPDARLTPFVAPLEECVERFGLGRRSVLAAFVATLAHESDSFKATREYHDGRRYEGREDLGNTQPGDGKRFPGRGLIQITGRLRSQRCADFFALPLDEWCQWAETPYGAAQSAGWFFAWFEPGCVRAALAGDFIRVCRLVGGNPPNGLKDRVVRYGEVLRWFDAQGGYRG